MLDADKAGEMLTLTDLERAVLTAIADQETKHSSALRNQIALMTVSKRVNSGAGFYTYLIVSGEPLSQAKSPLGDIGAAVQGIPHGMGFLLWLDDGMAATLEGYTYGDDLTTEADLTGLGFSSVGPRLRR